LDGYKRNWERADTTSQEWSYNEVEMETDVFRHVLGTHPKINRILQHITYASDAKSCSDRARDKVVVEKESTIDLFRLLDKIHDVKFNTFAEWDESTRSGVSVTGSQVQVLLDLRCI
jgi:hypothetical protein